MTLYTTLLASSFALFALTGTLYLRKRSVAKLIISLCSLAAFLSIAVTWGLSTTDTVLQKKGFVVVMVVWVFLLTVYSLGVTHVTGRPLSRGLSYMEFRRLLVERNMNGLANFLLILGPILVFGLAALVVFAYLLE